MEKEKLELLLLLLQSHISVIPVKKFSDFLEEAEKEMENIDIKDAPFIALALKLKIPIWSNDLHFKKQRKVQAFDTAEIMNHFLDYLPGNFKALIDSLTIDNSQLTIKNFVPRVLCLCLLGISE